MSKRLIMSFKPTSFYPVPEGTILKYLGHDLNYDTKEYTVICEIIGLPTREYKNELSFVTVLDTSKVNIPKVQYE